MKVIIIALTLVATFAFASTLPQGHGTPSGPSGKFAMTQNWAAPPVDLSQAIILLPLATPITEEPQEPKLKPAPRPPLPTKKE